ncbi:MAG: lysophospholipase [Treponema sp.]|nr:lysophospholipase [Treponema sp.]
MVESAAGPDSVDHDTFWIDRDDGTKLFTRRWRRGGKRAASGGSGASGDGEPGDGEPAALLLLVHGMAEHSLRYARFARACGRRGIEVWAADMRGHGKTAGPIKNGEGKNGEGAGGLLGHCADSGGFFRAVEDIRGVARYMAKTARTEYGGDVPFFIMGHSWGSFLVQGYIEDPAESPPLSGCVLSGTRGPGGAKIVLGAAFLSLLARLKGARRFSKLAQALSTGSYNKPFRPNRTPFDWLSGDPKEVDAYIADPLCGRPCSSGFYRDMIGGLAAIHRKSAMARIDKNLPLYAFYGDADPVGDMGASPGNLFSVYRSLGMIALEFHRYPGCRHEALNETCRDDVTEELLDWLSGRIEDTRIEDT